MLVLVVACAHGVTKITEALAQWLALHARAGLTRAASAAPAGVEVAGRDRDGASWLVRSARVGRR
jgi:hypothetical protein